MHHKLKTLPAHFDAVLRGDKKFEIRNNADRGFQKGDTVLLKKLDETTKLPTGMVQLVEITYVSNYNQPSNQVVFAFTLVGEPYMQEDAA